MLTEKDYKEIKKELDECQKPLFFFDDDPDGLSSFLLLYRYKNEGKGIIVKTHPKLDTTLLPKVEEYNPDKIFIVDVPLVEQEFVDGCKRPVIHVDHHTPLDLHGVKYFNPRVKGGDKHQPASYLCYKTVKQDLWLAAVGTVGDWFFMPLLKEFKKEYPKLLPDEIKTAPDALYTTPLGKLIRIFSFILKGNTHDAMKYIKVLTRIQDPREVLEQTTAQGKFLYKRYEKINKKYESLLNDAVEKASKEAVLVYTYDTDKMSFSSDLSNELIYRYPDKIIVVGRSKSGYMKGSIRSSKRIISGILEKALVGVDGYGGGHELACGYCVHEDDFDRFIENLKRELSEE
jgi:single-stranded DNA-specific DHH superfamily exonuclease